VWDNSRLLNVMGTKFANTQKVAILKFFPNHPYLGRAWMRSFFWWYFYQCHTTTTRLRWIATVGEQFSNYPLQN